MAYFATSALVNGQAEFTTNMLSAEWRLPDVAAFQVANKGVIANPSLQDLRTDESRSVLAYFPIRGANGSASSRTYNHTGSRGDSLSDSISWTTFTETFSISLKQADNNVFTWATQFASTKRARLLSLMSRIDAWFVAALLADKTQVNEGGGDGEFNDTTDNYEVLAADKDFFFQNAKATMEFNDYKSELIGVMDDKAKMNMQRLSMQGSANATNLGWQFDGMNLIATTRSLLGSSFNGSGLFFENGLVAVVPWIPLINRKPLDPVKAMSYNGDFGSELLPELGITIAVHGYASRADTSSEQGDTQDLLYEEELSVDVGFVSAPLSTLRGANDSPVYSIAQLK